mgnify:CR=1 FL=1
MQAEERFDFLAEDTDIGERIDRFLQKHFPERSRSALQKLTADGHVSVNGRSVSKNYKLSGGDTVSLIIPEPKELDVLPERIPLDIVYEDNDLVVVNKPKGIVVHPAPGNLSGTLVNALLYHCKNELSGINGVIRPGIVHRIDKDTSGLLMVAKSDKAHLSLAKQIKEHSFDRVYETVVYGTFREDSGTVDAPIGRHPVDRKKMAVTDLHSRDAITHFQVLERFSGFTHLRVTLETGRTHQIRVHMAYIGHPVAGDPVYGPKKVITELDGQCLHAKVIGFTHPTTGERMIFESELPDYFVRFLNKLK